MTDRTFSDFAEFGTDGWCAATLGMALTNFRQRRDVFEREGFPQVDGLIGLTNKSDVQAWIAGRRRVADAGIVHHDHHAIQPGANLHEL